MQLGSTLNTQYLSKNDCRQPRTVLKTAARLLEKHVIFRSSCHVTREVQYPSNIRS